MSASSALPALRKTLSLAKKFPQYNFREYFVRRVQDDICALKKGEYAGDAKVDLAQMQRMVSINGLFESEPLVIEPSRKRKRVPKAK